MAGLEAAISFACRATPNNQQLKTNSCRQLSVATAAHRKILSVPLEHYVNTILQLVKTLSANEFRSGLPARNPSFHVLFLFLTS